MDIGTFSVASYEEYKETGDINLFERVIDALMIEKYSNDKEISEYIESLSREDKRIAILSLLDGDNGMWVKLKSLIKGNELTKMDHIKDVILMLRDFVKVGEVEKKKFGEVMTPLELVKEMISTLPEEVWLNPNLKILDPCNGTGPYPLMVIYKLMKGLEDWEPDPNKRYKHIVENMIYTCELQARNVFLWLCAVDPHDEYKTNTYWGSFLEDGFDKHMKEVWCVEKFDIVLGNPPYQEMDGGNRASAKPLYNKFIDKSILICDVLTMIVPSRWFAGGKGLDDFRKRMIESNSIKLLKHYGNNGTEIFGNNVLIAGGVSYFLFDKNHKSNKFNFNGIPVEQKYDIIVRDPYCYSILDKISNFKSMDTIVKPRSFYNIATNDSRLYNDKVNDNYLKCFVSQQKGFIKYIDRNSVHRKFYSHKVVTPRAYMTAENGLGNIFYAEPTDLVTDSYIFLITNSKKESESLMSFLKTKFVNYLICLRKIDSSIKPTTFKWVPMVPFDREWTDSQLYEYFNLTEEEINLIESSAK